MFILAAALSLGWDADRWRDVGQWTVYTHDKNCSILADHESGSSIRISYSPDGDLAVLQIFDDKLPSMTNKQATSVAIRFEGAGRIDDGWGSRTAQAFVTQEGKYIFRGVQVRLKASEFLRDVSVYNSIRLAIDGVALRSFNLSSSAQAVAAVRECSDGLLRNVPRGATSR
jgi:hypothetical protein